MEHIQKRSQSELEAENEVLRGENERLSGQVAELTVLGFLLDFE